MTKRLEVDKEYWIKAKLTIDDKTDAPYCFEIADSPANWFSENIEAVEAIPEREKVTIPKFVAEWIEQNRYKTLFSALGGADWNNSPWIDWVKEIGNTATPQEIFARAWLDGYEVEKEKMYIIPLKGLITTDGHQQYLTGKVGRYFASRRNYSLKQTFTKIEVDNNVPACYREWAEPVEEE